MALSGRDLAILSARAGVARAGAIRAGFCPDDVEGAGHSEPGEYIWKEDKPPTTLWTLATDNCYCGTPPVAAFTYTPHTGAVTLTVAFTDTSTGGIVFWYWDFGDGDSSTSQNPSHDYTTAGTYTVSLWVSGPGGVCTEAATGTVVVTPTPGSISGTVTFSGVAQGVVLVTLTPGGATTNTNGETNYYEFLSVTPGASSVTATKTGGSGSNSGVVVSGEALVLDILVEPV